MATPQVVAQPQVVTVAQPQMQTQQVVMMAPVKPYPGFLENKPLMMLILIGAIMLLLGSIMVNAAPMLTNKEYTDNAVYNNDVRTQKSMGYIGNILTGIGVFFIFAFLLMAAVVRTDLSDYTRFGLLLLIGLVMFGARFTIP